MRAASRVLVLSTAAFTLLFAVWLMLGMLSIRIKPELGLTDSQLYYLTLAAILPGALLRFHFGVWTDRLGGRHVMTALLLFTVVPTYLVSRATDFTDLLLCTLLYGMAGNAFAVGVAWNAAWFPRDRQGTALGIFGAGNVGASVTKLIGPALIAAIPTAGLLGGIIPGGWRLIPAVYAVLLIVMAAAVWSLAPREDRTQPTGRTLSELLALLRHPRVWEYGLQYTVVFGAYVALSGVLPAFYFANHGAELAAELDADADRVAAWIGTLSAICFVFPASLLRPVGGWLSDRYGPRIVTASVFAAMLASGALLALPVDLGVWGFTAALFVLGIGMGVGKASVYKSIPDDFPTDVGAVGGLVGLLGALGGVAFPLAWAWVPGSTFLVLLGATAVSAAWFAVSHAPFGLPRQRSSWSVKNERNGISAIKMSDISAK